MKTPVMALFLYSLALLAQDAREFINKGVAAFKSARYSEAVELFRQAVELEPANANARLYLGTAYMTQWIPGATTPENNEFAGRAREQMEEVLKLEPSNLAALRSLASLAFNQHNHNDAERWYKAILVAKPDDKEAFYSLGVIAWSRAYPAIQEARKRAGMVPEAPGPLAGGERLSLSARYLPLIEDGIHNLEKAVQLDPSYGDALAYVNLLYRLRGDLRDTPAEAQSDYQRADSFVQQALAAKRLQQGSTPPPPPGTPGVQRIRVGGNVQAANVIRKVAPVYPAAAREALIQGTVRFQVVIAKDGAVTEIQVVRGHPLLVPSAQDAVRQWTYKPTLLNGSPVEVITEIDVNYTLEP